MTLTAHLYWSFRSPYSYLGTRQYCEIADTYDIDIKVKPVYPIAIRNPDFFTKINPQWVSYLMHDCARNAEYRGITFKWPSPDPVVMDIEKLAISDDQPYIFWLTRLGVEAAKRGKGLSFLNEVSQMIFDGNTINWHEGDHMSRAAERAGLDLAEMEAAIAGHEQEYDNVIADNQAELDASGHWGVPTLVFDGEPFFGQDRIDTAVWRMKQKGLQER
jgi:2-hydroxychromene-2-carboxylate isomerase